MTSFDIKLDDRAIQYGRFASMVLRTLKQAVAYRVDGACKQQDIAKRLEWHPTQLSRVLNGRVNNLSIKTVSDILWACDFEPEDMVAEPLEKIAPNQHCYFTPTVTHVETLKNNVLVYQGFNNQLQQISSRSQTR